MRRHFQIWPLSVRLRSSERKYLSQRGLCQRTTEHQRRTVDAIEEFARANGLEVVEVSIPRRTVVLKGTVAQMSQAFAGGFGNV